MTTFSEGLNDIRVTLDKGMQHLAAAPGEDGIQVATMREVSHGVAELAKFNATLDGIRQILGEGIAGSLAARRSSSFRRGNQPHKIEVVNKVPNIFLDIIRNQFRVLQTWMGPILQLAELFPDADGLQKAAEATERNYQKLIKQIGESQLARDDDTE